ncbi:MAG: LPS export ABC transporter periplasmic protein LptC [Flavobacteriaceae bacterium]|nr:LPS export ABC transporter periplasmic protein LptC [Flavobacteriaceae bacterium]
MKRISHIHLKNIVTVSLVAMFFSCGNNSKELRNLLLVENLPIGVAKNINHVYKDSGKITSKMYAPILRDFSNRKEHPYNEFPKGLQLITFDNGGKDSVTIVGNYALTYAKTGISELKGNVVITNHTDGSKLYTEQLFWDQKTDYFFSEKKFTLIKVRDADTLKGKGFESKKDLTKFIAKQISGPLTIKED